MNTTTEIASTATKTSEPFSPYEFAILRTDQAEQQAQIDQLRTEIREIKSSYITLTNTTQVSPLDAISARQSGFYHSLQVFKHPQSFSNLTEVDYFSYLPEASEKAPGRPETPFLQEKNSEPASAVPLHSLLKFTGAVMGVAAVASIAFWIVGRPPIFNPFISLMILVASPFAYAMGVAAQRR